jgi:hypothetical protein
MTAPIACECATCFEEGDELDYFYCQVCELYYCEEHIGRSRAHPCGRRYGEEDTLREKYGE